jgi:hypothetical protein
MKALLLIGLGGSSAANCGAVIHALLASNYPHVVVGNAIVAVLCAAAFGAQCVMKS